MSTFDRLPAKLRAALIHHAPGAVIYVPVWERPTDQAVIAAVIEEESAGHSQRASCRRVGIRLHLHQDTVWRILSRARVRAIEHPCCAPGVDPEYGQG